MTGSMTGHPVLPLADDVPTSLMPATPRSCSPPARHRRRGGADRVGEDAPVPRADAGHRGDGRRRRGRPLDIVNSFTTASATPSAPSASDRARRDGRRAARRLRRRRHDRGHHHRPGRVPGPALGDGADRGDPRPPAFFEVGVVLLVPVVILVARRHGRPADAGRHPGAGRPLDPARPGPAAPRSAGRHRRPRRRPRADAPLRPGRRRADPGDLRPAAGPVRREWVPIHATATWPVTMDLGYGQTLPLGRRRPADRGQRRRHHGPAATGRPERTPQRTVRRRRRSRSPSSRSRCR